MSFATQLLVGWFALALVMTIIWLVQRRTKNAGTVDVAWTFGIGLLALLYAATSPGSVTARGLVALIAGAWSLRLGSYLALRVFGHDEDGRYSRLREEWGENAERNLFVFFQLQALLAVVLVLGLHVVAWNERLELGGWAITGLLIAALSIGGESLADHQLAQFKADPSNRGKTCRAGLWRYSRHPNYFFEWLHWCAYVPLAVGAPYAAIALAPPLVMLFLLFRVTGIPATEEQALRSRGDDYRDYQRTTSAFVPWFPSAETNR